MSSHEIQNGADGPAPSPARRYLFTLIDGGGTVPPELGVARRLVDRGHLVVILAEETMRDQIARTGAAFLPWSVSWGQFQDWELRTPTRLMRGMVDHMFVGPSSMHARDTEAAIERYRPDLVLTSFSAVGAMIAAEARSVPFDVMFPNVYALPTPGTPPFGAGLRPARGPIGRMRDRVARRAGTAMFDRYALAPVNALRAEKGLGAVAHSWDQLHHARRELVLTSAAFDFSGQVPENVRYVGPVLDDPSWAESASWKNATRTAATAGTAGTEPLVLVALSSTFQNQAQSLQRIVDALGTLPVRGLVTTGPAIEPGVIRAPATVTVVASAPHQEVLREASVVVTHGGHGTVIKALAAGVPMVILPQGRDQADNAVRVTTRGAGVRVPRGAAPRRIADAIATVLATPGYRDAAIHLGRRIRQDAVSGAVINEVENLAGRPDSSLPH